MELDLNTQPKVVEQIFIEMKQAESFLSNLGATWLVIFLDAYCLDIHHNGQSYIEKMEDKYMYKHCHRHKYVLPNSFYNTDDIGVPLATKTLFGYNMTTEDPNYPFHCKFGRIDWTNIKVNQFKSEISFVNNGDISLHKYSHHEKNPQVKWLWYEYKILYNVLKAGFKLKGFCQLTSPSSPDEEKSHLLDVCFENNILTIKNSSDDIEIIHNLSTGTRKVRITKKNNKRNKIAASFEATFNANDSLEKVSLSVYTHKKNGKINGTYRLDVNRKKGIQAYFYSKKGVKSDMRTDFMLFDTLDRLLPSILGNSIGDTVIWDFLASLKSAIYNNRFEEFIDADCLFYDINLATFVEDRTIEMIESMKDELPLLGLYVRVQNLLNRYKKVMKYDGNKSRRLTLNPDNSSS